MTDRTTHIVSTVHRATSNPIYSIVMFNLVESVLFAGMLCFCSQLDLIGLIWSLEPCSGLAENEDQVNQPNVPASSTEREKTNKDAKGKSFLYQERLKQKIACNGCHNNIISSLYKRYSQKLNALQRMKFLPRTVLEKI